MILGGLTAAGDIVKVKIPMNGLVQNKFIPMRSADLTMLKASEIGLMESEFDSYFTNW